MAVQVLWPCPVLTLLVWYALKGVVALAALQGGVSCFAELLDKASMPTSEVSMSTCGWHCQNGCNTDRSLHYLLSCRGLVQS